MFIYYKQILFYMLFVFVIIDYNSNFWFTYEVHFTWLQRFIQSLHLLPFNSNNEIILLIDYVCVVKLFVSLISNIPVNSDFNRRTCCKSKICPNFSTYFFFLYFTLYWMELFRFHEEMVINKTSAICYIVNNGKSATAFIQCFLYFHFISLEIYDCRFIRFLDHSLSFDFNF